MYIEEKWKTHPLTLQGHVELVPTEWVYAYYGTDVTPQTNLKDGTIVDMETLWEDIKSEGLHDPFIMRVGVYSKTFRLESGNHRIQVFHKHRVPFVPLAVEIKDECGPDATDGMTDATHNFPFTDDINLPDVQRRYCKPSYVFKSLQK